MIVDFTNVPVGTEITCSTSAPDEPFGGGVPGVDFEPADPATTGRVMQFEVVPSRGRDTSTPPASSSCRRWARSARRRDPASCRSTTGVRDVKVSTEGGNIVLDCAGGEPFAPAEATSEHSTPTAAESRSAGTSR